MNSPVFLSHYQYQSVAHDSNLMFEHPLKRRMSPMQLAVMEAFAQLSAKHPILERAIWQQPIPIYFATAFGELSSALNVSESVHLDHLPCSPTAFQHSVHNCAPAYLTMSRRVNHPSLTISNGCLSLDKALFLAFQKIRHQLCDAAIVIGGKDLMTDSSPTLGECEIAILSNDEFCREHLPTHEIMNLCYAGDSQAASALISDLEPGVSRIRWQETLLHQPSARLLDDGHVKNFQRIIANLKGETILSSWRGLCN